MQRFAGSVAWLSTVDISEMAAWLAAIPFEDWPQQSLRELRPAMVTDLSWHGFGAQAAPIVAALMDRFPGCVPEQQMLSAVMPGHTIEPHVDHQGPKWLCRVHVPLLTNAASFFIVGGKHHSLVPSHAYRVNTEVEHAVTNGGISPRVHFMFDVRTNG